MRLIDADEIRIKPEYMHNICGSVMIRVEDVARIISEMPTIDPQPQWIPVSEGMPKERDSIFAKLYKTKKWRDAMFRKTSNTVITTVELKDGTRQTTPCYTIDGEWNQSIKGMGKVLAWMVPPEPWKGKSDETN